MSLLAGGAPGIGLIYNATSRTIVSVQLQQLSMLGAPQVKIPPLQLLQAPFAPGSSALSGCAFPIPSSGDFALQVGFDQGPPISGSFRTDGQGAPALFIIVFLNGFVLARPDGTAGDLSFQRNSPNYAPGITLTLEASE